MRASQGEVRLPDIPADLQALRPPGGVSRWLKRRPKASKMMNEYLEGVI